MKGKRQADCEVLVYVCLSLYSNPESNVEIAECHSVQPTYCKQSWLCWHKALSDIHYTKQSNSTYKSDKNKCANFTYQIQVPNMSHLGDKNHNPVFICARSSSFLA